MFVTQQLRTAVDDCLKVVEARAQWLEAAAAWTPAEWSDETRVWAAERALHVATECMTDAANRVIDALVLRDPGDYADILRVLSEEGAVDAAWFHGFEPMLAVRSRLARAYPELERDQVIAATVTHGPQFRPFVSSLRAYLGISSR